MSLSWVFKNGRPLTGSTEWSRSLKYWHYVYRVGIVLNNLENAPMHYFFNIGIHIHIFIYIFCVFCCK